MNKKIISYAIIPVIGLALAGGASVTLAAPRNVNQSKPMDALAAAIAAKFNLNSAEVQAVIDQEMSSRRTAMEAEQAKNFSDRLAKAVAEKKLTQAQADLITAKLAELKAVRENAKDQTPAERLAAMKAQMASLKQWAADNKIPEGYLMFGRPEMDKGHGPRDMHRMREGGMNMMHNRSQSDK